MISDNKFYRQKFWNEETCKILENLLIYLIVKILLMFIYIFVLHNGILKDLYNSFIDMQIDLIQYCNAFSLFQSFKSTTLILCRWIFKENPNLYYYQLIGYKRDQLIWIIL